MNKFSFSFSRMPFWPWPSSYSWLSWLGLYINHSYLTYKLTYLLVMILHFGCLPHFNFPEIFGLYFIYIFTIYSFFFSSFFPFCFQSAKDWFNISFFLGSSPSYSICSPSVTLSLVELHSPAVVAGWSQDMVFLLSQDLLLQRLCWTRPPSPTTSTSGSPSRAVCCSRDMW